MGLDGPFEKTIYDTFEFNDKFNLIQGMGVRPG